MSLIAQLLKPENIVIDLNVSSKKRLFEHVGLIFENNDGIAQRTVFESLFAREKLGSTGLGRGVAIPHGRIKGLKKVCSVFVRLNPAIPFESPDGQPVSLLFILLVPEIANELHLQILSELAQRFAAPEFREALANAQEASAIRDCFA